jgi:hypothetical protein
MRRCGSTHFWNSTLTWLAQGMPLKHPAEGEEQVIELTTPHADEGFEGAGALGDALKLQHALNTSANFITPRLTIGEQV